MSNVVAGVGRGQLKVLDQRVAKKNYIFEFYKRELGGIEGIEFMPSNDWDEPNYWLRRCLDSIIEQTYRDLEILLIDDGSTDGSGEICDKYAERDERIRVFHTENRGLSCARNLGLDNARGGLYRVC